MKRSPTWAVIVVTTCGVTLFAGAVVSLVMTVRKTGSDQWFWAFQCVMTTITVALLLSVFASRD